MNGKNKERNAKGKNRRNENLQKKKNAVESVFTVEDQRAANIGRQWRLEIPKNLLLTEARN